MARPKKVTPTAINADEQALQSDVSKFTADLAQEDTPVPASAPVTVTLAAPYVFYDDHGTEHVWLAHETVSDPDDIATLIQRGARLK